MDKLTALLQSRRFWAAVGGLVLAVSDGLGLGLTPQTIENVVWVVSAWIVADGIRNTAVYPREQTRAA